MVAQVDEQQPAMVALAVHQPDRRTCCAGIGGAQRAAGVGAIGVHGGLLMKVGPHHSWGTRHVKAAGPCGIAA